MNVIKERISAMIGDDASVEVNKITGEVVKTASVTLKKSKGDASGSFT